MAPSVRALRGAWSLATRSHPSVPKSCTFSTSAVHLSRRREVRTDRDDSSFKAISGKLSEDGLNRYELDFIETAKWVKELLLKMKNAKAEVGAHARPFVPPDRTRPFCVRTVDDFTYDFSQPAPRNTRVSVLVSVADLNLTPEQRHKFLLLAGTAYNPYTDVVEFTRETPEERDSGFPEQDREGNRAEVLEILTRMVEEAKQGDAFLDVPLDLQHVPPRRAGLEFPVEWLRPKDGQPAQVASTQSSSPVGRGVEASTPPQGASP
ncbi:37S ribosomal protein S24, mitochondrial [Borealophlyctis nickersoniae]|nr:37S ribosomal protein S24, mitochondrial [Borealophlyctis nickersoniae]